MTALRWLSLFGFMFFFVCQKPILATASSYPSHVITFLVPYPAGGPTDLIARMLANSMGDQLGQQIIIENVGGASGTIGANRVARSDADGYTLLMHNITFAAAPVLYKSHTYDALKDFDPIGLVSESSQAVVAKKTTPAKDLSELIAYIKKDPKNINIADAGRGSGSYLCNLFLAHAIDATMTTVSYRGTGPALNDLLGGQVDLMCDQVANTGPQIKAGNIKAYCVTTKARLEILPSVPTCEEAGLADLEASVWVALLGPHGLPPEVVTKLASALHHALHDPTVVQRMAEFATIPASDELATPEGLRGFLKHEVDKWRSTLTAMHVKPE